MKKVFLIFGVILIIFAGLGYWRATGRNRGDEGSGGYKGPKIVVEPEKWDFGEVRQPNKVNHDFVVKNVGTETLEIKRVSTSCGCTTAEIDKEKIEGGEKAILAVIYDSNAMKHERGDLERIVYLKTNDLERPQVEIVIRVRVI